MIILTGLGARVDRIAFSHDGQALFASTDLQSAVWKLPDAGKPTVISGFSAAAFTPDGTQLIGAKDDKLGQIKLHATKTEFNPRTGEITYLGNSKCIRLSPDASRVIASKIDPELLWWSWPSFKPMHSWKMELCGDWCIADAVFSPDGKTIAVFQYEAFTIHDTDTGHIRWQGPIKSVTNSGCLAWSPKGDIIAAAAGKFLRVFNASDGQPLSEIKQASKHFLGIEFTRDGRYLATVSNEETVKFFDTTSWGLHTEMAWQIGGLRAIAFSRCGTLAAAGSSKNKVVVWDLDL